MPAVCGACLRVAALRSALAPVCPFRASAETALVLRCSTDRGTLFIMADPGPSHEGQAGDHFGEVTDARLRSYDGLPLTIPEVEGEIGWGATPMFEPWQDTGWEADERLRISNGGKTATAMLEMTCVAAMGESTFSAGLHAWTVIIEVGSGSGSG